MGQVFITLTDNYIFQHQLGPGTAFFGSKSNQISQLLDFSSKQTA
jgi:hypothetical protein